LYWGEYAFRHQQESEAQITVDFNLQNESEFIWHGLRINEDLEAGFEID
jgi:hypothetical protein